MLRYILLVFLLLVFQVNAEKSIESIFNISSNACTLANPLEETLCEVIYHQAPEQVKDLIKLIPLLEKKSVLNTRASFQQAWPSRLLLIGRPGCGKTTLAQVIAQKLNRSAYVIRAPMVGNEYKNSEASNLLRLVEPLIEAGKPIVIIIDEINILAEVRKDGVATDTSVAGTLWLLLDIVAKYPHILIIGTANEVKNLPPQLKDRFEGSVIEIEKNDLQARFEILSFYFSKESSLLTVDYIWSLTKKTRNFSIRQIEALYLASKQNQIIRNSYSDISKEDIEKAVIRFTTSSVVLKPPLFFEIKKWIQDNAIFIQTMSASVNLAAILGSLCYFGCKTSLKCNV